MQGLSIDYTHAQPQFSLEIFEIFIYQFLSLSLCPARLPASKAIQTEGKDQRGPKGEKEEREIGTNPVGWLQMFWLQPPGNQGYWESTAEQTQQPISKQCPLYRPCEPIHCIDSGWGGSESKFTAALQTVNRRVSMYTTLHVPLLLCCTTVVAILGKR